MVTCGTSHLAKPRGYGRVYLLWLGASLKLLLAKVKQLGAPMLPKDMGGSGHLLHVLGEGCPPADADELPSMDLPAANYLSESWLSIMKRLMRRAPRAFARWLLGPILCACNGFFDVLANFPAKADAYWKEVACEALDPGDTMQKHLEEHATLQMQHEYAATMLRKAQRDAEKKQRMLGANVALTMADLEDMHQGAGLYGQEGNLAQRCKNMLERVLHEFPNTTAPGGVRCSAHGDTKFALVRGGGEKAFAKLVDIFLDEQRPWYHGAKARLAAQVA
jgi:hypothetical protein